MAWPELLKARKSTKNIENHINLLLSNHNGLTKRELARQSDTLLAYLEESMDAIGKEIDELKASLENHRKYVRSKSEFVKRHYSRFRDNKYETRNDTRS